MTKFRPCIDLHHGKVKQIVGGTLSHDDDNDEEGITKLKTNYISTHPASYYAELYRQTHLRGGHMIMLGPGNEDAAKDALKSWPNSLQIGGGITDLNVLKWLEYGAEKVIITSYLFPEGKLCLSRLESILHILNGDKTKLVIDLSCRRYKNTWFVAMNKWQTLTNFEINQENISILEPYCSEFLIHAADNEGLQQGIDIELITKLSKWCKIPITYAGGAQNLKDLDLVKNYSDGKIDLTIGSALDIFGGQGAKFHDCVEWNLNNN